MLNRFVFRAKQFLSALAYLGRIVLAAYLSIIWLISFALVLFWRFSWTLLWTLFAVTTSIGLVNVVACVHDMPKFVGLWGGAFVAGIIFSILTFDRLPTFHIWGHELTHWAVAKMFFRRTQWPKVFAGGGSVIIECPNFFITLAPYAFPFYSFVTMMLYLFIGILYLPFFLIFIFHIAVVALFSFFFGQHVAFTIRSLRIYQSDIGLYGRILPYPFIIFGNAISLHTAFYVWRVSSLNGFVESVRLIGVTILTPFI